MQSNRKLLIPFDTKIEYQLIIKIGNFKLEN